jgi:2-desacetyl-2-hydroxyethyl bacteriochlorophyllide A dehydrogenase
MGRVVRFDAPGSVVLTEEEEPAVGPDEVRVHTLYSGISAGTELTAYRGSNPYLRKLWDPERRLFVPGEVSFDYPIDGWGYEEVGRVVEVGKRASSPRVGDLVWGTWGHRSSAVLAAGYAAERILAETADPAAGVFAHIGAIALNAVLDAGIHVGETVAVFGQGVPGLIAGQLARLNGATVIAVDAIPMRRDLAEQLGASSVLAAEGGSVAERIKELTDGRGADVSIEITGSYRALHEAVRSTAYNSTVVASGFFQGEAAGLALGEEFHHNRIRIVCSQISGVNPGLDHRWDELRLQRTVMSLAAEDKLALAPLVSHIVPVDEAADAFALLDRAPETAVQVILSFQGGAR